MVKCRTHFSQHYHMFTWNAKITYCFLLHQLDNLWVSIGMKIFSSDHKSYDENSFLRLTKLIQTLDKVSLEINKFNLVKCTYNMLCVFNDHHLNKKLYIKFLSSMPFPFYTLLIKIKFKIFFFLFVCFKNGSYDIPPLIWIMGVGWFFIKQETYIVILDYLYSFIYLMKVEINVLIIYY